MSLVIETTRTCMRTPLILFVAEEIGASCEVVLREPGYFVEVHHTMGPMLHDGDFALLELDAILRHLARAHGRDLLMPADPKELATVDRWMELQATARLGAVRILASPEAPPEEASSTVRRCFAALEHGLGNSGYLLGRFTVADVHAVTLGHLGRAIGELATFPRVAAWAALIAERAACQRAMARMAALREVS
jgi:glutathione S-transferase